MYCVPGRHPLDFCSDKHFFGSKDPKTGMPVFYYYNYALSDYTAAFYVLEYTISKKTSVRRKYPRKAYLRFGYVFEYMNIVTQDYRIVNTFLKNFYRNFEWLS